MVLRDGAGALTIASLDSEPESPAVGAVGHLAAVVSGCDFMAVGLGIVFGLSRGLEEKRAKALAHDGHADLAEILDTMRTNERRAVELSAWQLRDAKRRETATTDEALDKLRAEADDYAPTGLNDVPRPVPQRTWARFVALSAPRRTKLFMRLMVGPASFMPGFVLALLALGSMFRERDAMRVAREQPDRPWLKKVTTSGSGKRRHTHPRDAVRAGAVGAARALHRARRAARGGAAFRRAGGPADDTPRRRARVRVEDRREGGDASRPGRVVRGPGLQGAVGGRDHGPLRLGGRPVRRAALVVALLSCTPRVAPPTAEPVHDLLVSEDDCEAVPERFSSSHGDVLLDLGVLERVLRGGWAGYDVRAAEGVDWKATFERLRVGIAELPEPVPSDVLQRYLAEGLRAARDNHLQLWWVDARGRRHGSSAVGPHLDAWTQDGGVGEGAFLARSPLRVEKRALVLAEASPGPEWRRLDGAASPARGRPFERDGGVLTLRSLDNAYPSALGAFVESAPFVRALPWAVLDLRGNGGGADTAAIDFVRGITSGALRYSRVDVLQSSVTRQGWANMYTCNSARPDIEREARLTAEEQRDAWLGTLDEGPVREVQSFTDNVFEGQAPAVFSGVLVVLVDRRCASACESLVTFARQVPGVVVAGENTAGAGVFGETLQYRLPRTGLWLRAGCKRFGWTEESRGVLPDFWIDDRDPLGVAIELAQCLSSPDCPIRKSQ